jgi:hypothetical protein
MPTSKYPTLRPSPGLKSPHFIWHGVLDVAHGFVSEKYEAFRKLGDAALAEPPQDRAQADGPTFVRGQELLRSMVVLASSAVEAALKWAIHESLDPLVSSEKQSANLFEAWVEKTISDPANTAYLAHVLSAPQGPRHVLIRTYVTEMAEVRSLQSTEALRSVAAALGLPFSEKLASKVEDAFRCRNEIIHDFDITEVPLDPAFPDRGKRKTRRFRSVESIVSHVNALFSAGDAILNAAVKRVAEMQTGKVTPPTVKRPANPKRPGPTSRAKS